MQLTYTGLCAIVFVLLCACASVLLVIPRPVAPTTTPALRLDVSKTRLVMDEDRKNANLVPDEQSIKLVDRLFRDQGRKELGSEVDTPLGVANKRAAVAAAITKHGEDVLDLLRSQAAERLIPALTGQTTPEDARAFVGSLGEAMNRYSMAKESTILAPAFVLRTAAKARWNAIFDRKLTEGMKPIEKEAYYGWLAFHGTLIGPEQRLEALQGYRKTSGTPVDDAEATLLFLKRDYAGAAKQFSDMHKRTYNLRVRNHALAAYRATPE